MTDTKLVDLPAASALDGTELVYLVQGGADVKATTQEIADLAPSSSVAWGDITGTLSSQTDLQSALDAKASLSGATFTGNITATNLSGTNTGDQDLSGYLTTSAAAAAYQPLATVLTNTTASFTTAQETKLSGIEAGADVTDAANVAAAGAVMESDYTPAHSILVQQSGTGSPTALQVGNNTLVGRLSGGGADIDDLSATDVKAMLNIQTSDVSGLDTALSGKQDTLVSGTSIKTINSTSLLGSGDIVISGSSEPVYFIQQTSGYTLTSTTAAQQIFNESTNGACTLPTGRYRFAMILHITGMSATSGNAQIRLLGGGTATVANGKWSVVGQDNNSPTIVGTRSGQSIDGLNSASSIVAAGTATGLNVNAWGVFNVTATGTIIPSIALVTAAAATVGAGSYFWCQKIADTGTSASSGWS